MQHRSIIHRRKKILLGCWVCIKKPVKKENIIKRLDMSEKDLIMRIGSDLPTCGCDLVVIYTLNP